MADLPPAPDGAGFAAPDEEFPDEEFPDEEFPDDEFDVLDELDVLGEDLPDPASVAGCDVVPLDSLPSAAPPAPSFLVPESAVLSPWAAFSAARESLR